MSDQKRFPWRTLLFVSLGVNLLLIGGAIGAFGAGARLERPSAQPAPSVDRLPGQRAFVEALPPQARAQLRQDMVQGVVQSRELRQAAAQRRREVLDAAGEPYDAARVKQAFERMRAADQAVVGVFHDRIADTLATLTPEERRAALETLRRAPPRRERMEERRRAWRERLEQRRSGGG